MCLDPATMIGIASSVMGYIGQQQQADAQEEANNRQRQSIMEQTAIRNEEVRQKQAQEVDMMSLEALKQKASARVAAGEAGISGISVEQQLNEIDMNLGQDLATINANAASQTRATNSSGKSQINSIAPVNRPSFLGTGLQIAGKVTKDSHMPWNK